MLRAEFLNILRFRLAEVAVGPSSLRNQGAPGVIAAARSFLKGLDLGSFVVPEQSRFLSRLEEATAALQNGLPAGTRHWGAARKALNLFLRDALYCSDLTAHYGLQAIRCWLEVPLDRYVVRGLRRYPSLSGELPRWLGIKYLSPSVSGEYQRIASAVAREENVARVDLDVIFWRAEMLRPTAAL
ncbi:MAG: hypothetical protein L0Z62_34600 [Gemmataceae bacterium]|nr:hypothetical protein [Gemmataceae bacterium]